MSSTNAMRAFRFYNTASAAFSACAPRSAREACGKSQNYQNLNTILDTVLSVSVFVILALRIISLIGIALIIRLAVVVVLVVLAVLLIVGQTEYAEGNLQADV